MKRYECTKCGSIHYENGSAFLQHIMHTSKRGIWDAEPPPPVKATPTDADMIGAIDIVDEARVAAGDQSIKGRLTEAWAIVTRFNGDAYVVASHAFVCHSDGSDCEARRLATDGGAVGDIMAVTKVCKPDHENLRMLSAALELHESQPDATFDDFKLAWAQHMVTQ